MNDTIDIELPGIANVTKEDLKMFEGTPVKICKVRLSCMCREGVQCSCSVREAE